MGGLILSHLVLAVLCLGSGEWEWMEANLIAAYRLWGIWE